MISFRSVFEPPDGKYLLSADFCQLEMRILTCLCKDTSLVKIMDSNGDIFRELAAKWHKMNEPDVTDLLRNQTKEMCYSIIYGKGMAALAEDLNVEKEEAVRLSEEFHKAYPRIKKYIDEIVERVRKNGFVETMTGRRRYLPAINSTISKERSQADRQAFNTAIQGSASDIAKSALLKMKKEIKDNGLEKDVNFVLHMHDELIYEVSPQVKDLSAQLLKYCMEKSVEQRLTLKVKVKLGKNWGEMKEIQVKEIKKREKETSQKEASQKETKKC